MAMQQKQFEEDKEDWLITYADAITLLMAFFVMLLTFSKFDIPAFEEAAAAIKSNLSGRQETSPIQLLRIDVQDVVYNMQADQVVKVRTDNKGVVIDLSSSAFYVPGSADIREEAVPVLEKLTQALLAPRYQLYVVEVEGHTDDDPINTDAFPSNWELSAARATRIVRFFVDKEMESLRLRATGYADTQPIASNRDLQGNPIKDNQTKNRRVSVRVYPMSKEQRALVDETIAFRAQAKQAAESGKAMPAAPGPATPDEKSDGPAVEPATPAATGQEPPKDK
ncbi:MAG: OmpA family protein [Rhodospirillales bacterium]|nr:OmpA family protein [Rhodospirillales bacterium]